MQWADATEVGRFHPEAWLRGDDVGSCRTFRGWWNPGKGSPVPVLRKPCGTRRCPPGFWVRICYGRAYAGLPPTKRGRLFPVLIRLSLPSRARRTTLRACASDARLRTRCTAITCAGSAAALGGDEIGLFLGVRFAANAKTSPFSYENELHEFC